MELHPLVTQLQAQYPRPIPVDEDDGSLDCYCVGGAVVMYVELCANDPTVNTAFPDPGLIADALCHLNTALSLDLSLRFAEHIINANDEGKAWKAWRYLSEALQPKPKVYVIDRDLMKED